MPLSQDIGGSPTQSSCATILEYNCQSQSSENFIENSIRMEDYCQSANSAGDNIGIFDGAHLYPKWPLWRGRHYELLNKNYIVFRRAQIQVCMPKEPFDEDGIGDYDVGVIFFSDGEKLRTICR